MTHPLEQLVPRPNTDTATTPQVVVWYAAQALFHLGRAERRRELHGDDDATHLHLINLAAQEVATARVLRGHHLGLSPDEVARFQLAAADAGDATYTHAFQFTAWGVRDPEAVYRAGYQS